MTIFLLDDHPKVIDGVKSKMKGRCTVNSAIKLRMAADYLENKHKLESTDLFLFDAFVPSERFETKKKGNVNYDDGERDYNGILLLLNYLDALNGKLDKVAILTAFVTDIRNIKSIGLEGKKYSVEYRQPHFNNGLGTLTFERGNKRHTFPILDKGASNIVSEIETFIRICYPEPPAKPPEKSSDKPPLMV
jgi:hypothetical protein